ncbi:MAG: hypothetical protein LQ349_009805, partial [Xanthoria aureola]
VNTTQFIQDTLPSYLHRTNPPHHIPPSDFHIKEFSKRTNTIQYKQSIMPTATPAPLPLVSQLKNDKRILIYIVLGLGGTLLLIVIAFFWHRHRKHQRARGELA